MTTHIINRTVFPASEYKTVFLNKENSGVCELTYNNPVKVTKDRLYDISRKLHQEKAGFENDTDNYL